ncbi:hypothetical protein CHUAL_000281 [Chamberlinius hualienensis]
MANVNWDLTDGTPINEYPPNLTEADAKTIQTWKIDWSPGHYKIKNSHLAQFYIFNHNVFERKLHLPSPKSGSEKDIKELTNVLEDLNCVPGSKTHEDLTLLKLKRELAKISEKDHSDCSAIIIAIFSHGDEGIIYAKDESYKLQDLWKPFVSPRSHKSLTEKPKIFIIQASRAIPVNQELVVTDSSVCNSPNDGIKLPSFADFLFFSSPPAEYKFDMTNGSPMIQALCQGMKKHKDQLDLQSIITLVMHQVRSHPKCYYRVNQNKIDTTKMMPFVTSTFTKKLFLTQTCLENHPAWSSKNNQSIDSTDNSSKEQTNRKVSITFHDRSTNDSNEPQLQTTVDDENDNNQMSMLQFTAILGMGLLIAITINNCSY